MCFGTVSLPKQICISFWNGKHPETITYKTIPSDHTVASNGLYAKRLNHSGGQYERVPEI